jgi:hypothetical protein
MSGRPILEAEFQGLVLELARTLGWRHLHVRRSIGKGRQWVTATNVPWPDLTLWRPAPHAGFLVRELKVPPVKFQPGQLEVLEELASSGIDAGWWVPDDLDNGIILASLRRAPTVRESADTPRAPQTAENRPQIGRGA